MDFAQGVTLQAEFDDDFDARVQSEQASGFGGVGTYCLSCTLQDYLNMMDMGTGSQMATADFWAQHLQAWIQSAL